MLFIRLLTALEADESGATAVEYGLILALIFLSMLGAVEAFSNQLIGMWTTVANTTSTAMGGAV